MTTLRPGLAACGPLPAGANLRVELGEGEVLSVEVLGAGDRRHCVEELVWAAQAPHVRHVSATFSLGT
jgi:hypothetical protein